MPASGYLLGYDVGSSSIKATLLDAETGTVAASATSPKAELEMTAKKPGWAEQDPELWWQHVQNATQELSGTAAAALADVRAIGISYQMHGLVVVDEQGQVLRPSIIWCDSRAVPYGNQAWNSLGHERCLKHLLNSPGNFTAAKLAWVKDNEPELFQRIYKFMLPGDYIAYRLTGEICTTPSGLSEGILWDMQDDAPADFVLDYYGFPKELVADVKPTFSVQGEVTGEVAKLLGIKAGVPVAYRAGDQPNNAFSLNVLEPGELAATAGTSGVVYGIDDRASYDPRSRVNSFVHVNHTKEAGRYGVLMCLNGTGILNRWLKQNTLDTRDHEVTYDEVNRLALEVGPGAEGLVFLPFGNGAERILENQDLGGQVHGLNFNIHRRQHLLRAGQEGIIFALQYGVDIMKEMGIEVSTIKAGYANMFLSPLFRQVFATVTGAQVQLYSTDGSQGAARGAGVGAGVYTDVSEAFVGLEQREVVDPDESMRPTYNEAYLHWLEVLRGAASAS